MKRVAIVLLFVVFGAGCDTDFAKGFGDLFSIRSGVVEIVHAKNVKVNLQNGSALSIYIINSSLNLQPAQSRNLAANKISRMAYERFTNRQKLEVVYVVFSAHEKKFAVVDITSTVQMFQYTPKDIKGLMDDGDTATPSRPIKSLQPTPGSDLAASGG